MASSAIESMAQRVQALGRALAERLARALPPQQIDERRQAAALADRRLVRRAVHGEIRQGPGGTHGGFDAAGLRHLN